MPSADALVPALVLDQKPYDLDDALRAGVPSADPMWIRGGVRAMIADWAKAGPWLRRAAPVAAELVGAGKLKPLAAQPA